MEHTTFLYSQHNMSYASEDSKPFLASDIDEQDSFDLTPSERPTSQYQSSSKPLWRRNLWIVHVLFLVLNIGFFLYNMGYVGTKTGPDQAILEQTYCELPSLQFLQRLRY